MVIFTLVHYPRLPSQAVGRRISSRVGIVTSGNKNRKEEEFYTETKRHTSHYREATNWSVDIVRHQKQRNMYLLVAGNKLMYQRKGHNDRSNQFSANRAQNTEEWLKWRRHEIFGQIQEQENLDSVVVI